MSASGRPAGTATSPCPPAAGERARVLPGIAGGGGGGGGGGAAGWGLVLPRTVSPSCSSHARSESRFSAPIFSVRPWEAHAFVVLSRIL